MNTYRVDEYNSVYVLEDGDDTGYKYIGKLRNKTKEEFIKEYERQESTDLGDIL